MTHTEEQRMEREERRKGERRRWHDAGEWDARDPRSGRDRRAPEGTPAVRGDALAACPFCGTDCACPNYGMREGRGYVYFVGFCIGQTDDYVTMDEAIAAWNRRASPAAGPDVEGLGGEDGPWPVRDCLTKLADAADLLLGRYSYDGLGYEAIVEARDAARRHAAPREERRKAHDGPCPEVPMCAACWVEAGRDRRAPGPQPEPLKIDLPPSALEELRADDSPRWLERRIGELRDRGFERVGAPGPQEWERTDFPDGGVKYVGRPAPLEGPRPDDDDAYGALNRLYDGSKSADDYAIVHRALSTQGEQPREPVAAELAEEFMAVMEEHSGNRRGFMGAMICDSDDVCVALARLGLYRAVAAPQKEEAE